MHQWPPEDQMKCFFALRVLPGHLVRRPAPLTATLLLSRDSILVLLLSAWVVFLWLLCVSSSSSYSFSYPPRLYVPGFCLTYAKNNTNCVVAVQEVLGQALPFLSLFSLSGASHYQLVTLDSLLTSSRFYGMTPKWSTLSQNFFLSFWPSTGHLHRDAP